MEVSEPLDTSRSSSEPSGTAKSTVLLGGKGIVIAVAVLFLAGIAYFATIAFNAATVRFMSVEEVVQNEMTSDIKSIGVLGKLVPGSYIKSPDGVTANFRLKDEFGSTELPVNYSGEVGQVFFNDHSEIILNGTLGSDGVLNAETLTVRCPSKYLTEQEQMELDGQVEPPPYQPDYFDGPNTYESVMGNEVTVPDTAAVTSQPIEEFAVMPMATLGPPSTPEELVERVQDSVVRVEASIGNTLFGPTIAGSGFIFDVEGTTAFIATNYHVIDGSNSVEVQIGNSSTYNALVLGWDRERDVAVLAVRDCCSSDSIALKWGDASPSEGDSVVAIGYPNAGTGNLVATKGEVRAHDMLSIEKGFVPHSASLNPGNSSGPLLSYPGGEVVGINTGRGTETFIFYAVPYQSIEEQVEEWRSKLIAP